MIESDISIAGALGLHAGDWVIVRSQEEILASLDARGRLEELPFQPEMLAYCGRRMRVAKVAHKTCDNITKTGGRRLLRSVHLEGARCDGSFHGGCQADCVFYWKEAWLRRADAPAAVLPTASGGISEAQLLEAVHAPGDADPEDPTWVCQVTTVVEATTWLPWWDLRQYVQDVTSGNHTAWHMIKLLTAASYRRFVALGPGYNFKIKLYNSGSGSSAASRFRWSGPGSSGASQRPPPASTCSRANGWRCGRGRKLTKQLLRMA